MEDGLFKKITLVLINDKGIFMFSLWWMSILFLIGLLMQLLRCRNISLQCKVMEKLRGKKRIEGWKWRGLGAWIWVGVRCWGWSQKAGGQERSNPSCVDHGRSVRTEDVMRICTAHSARGSVCQTGVGGCWCRPTRAAAARSLCPLSGIVYLNPGLFTLQPILQKARTKGPMYSLKVRCSRNIQPSTIVPSQEKHISQCLLPFYGFQRPNARRGPSCCRAVKIASAAESRAEPPRPKPRAWEEGGMHYPRFHNAGIFFYPTPLQISRIWQCFACMKTCRLM